MKSAFFCSLLAAAIFLLITAYKDSDFHFFQSAHVFLSGIVCMILSDIRLLTNYDVPDHNEMLDKGLDNYFGNMTQFPQRAEDGSGWGLIACLALCVAVVACYFLLAIGTALLLIYTLGGTIDERLILFVLLALSVAVPIAVISFSIITMKHALNRYITGHRQLECAEMDISRAKKMSENIINFIENFHSLSQRERREWLGATPAAYSVYGAGFALFGMLAIDLGQSLDMALATLALCFSVTSCALGIQREPDFSKYTNFMKSLHYPTVLFVVLAFIYANFVAK